MAALFVVSDQPELEDRIEVSGKSLSRNSDELDALARESGLPSIFGFFSASLDDAMDFFDGDLDGVEVAEEQWFGPDDGLDYFKRLRQLVETSPSKLRDQDSDRVLEDIDDFIAALGVIGEAGGKFHLSVDF